MEEPAELTVLSVPGCPHVPILARRLDEVLGQRSEIAVRYVEIDSEQAAIEAGMRGSPTLLINGADPFTAPSAVPGLYCRLDLPSLPRLRDAITGQPGPGLPSGAGGFGGGEP
ncbi:MAG TPA: hypothetical protein VFQ44_05895 [Streptosporangiaceae bacterium]|nr:hypothetical protein [Streptosporangiaceae bacterium]